MVQLELGANATAQLLWAEGTARARIMPDDSHSGEWSCPAPALVRESKHLMCATAGLHKYWSAYGRVLLCFDVFSQVNVSKI